MNEIMLKLTAMGDPTALSNSYKARNKAPQGLRYLGTYLIPNGPYLMHALQRERNADFRQHACGDVQSKPFQSILIDSA